MLALGTRETLTIEVTELKPNAPLLVETLDQAHANAMGAWIATGCPEPLSREQTKLLRAATESTKKECFAADDSGRLRSPGASS